MSGKVIYFSFVDMLRANNAALENVLTHERSLLHVSKKAVISMFNKGFCAIISYDCFVLCWPVHVNSVFCV